eukprot:5730499-Prymnesium_polylepis.1
MPLGSRSNQLNNVLDLARLSQRASIGWCAALQSVREAAESGGRRHECMLLLSMWRSGRKIHPLGHLLYII